MTKDELMARLPEIEESVKRHADWSDWTTLQEWQKARNTLALCAAVRELAAENERLKGEYSPEWWADMEAKGEIG